MAKLYFRYGAMNSGKSTALLQVAHNYEERGMRVVLVKAALDSKGGANVTTRIGIEREVDLLADKGMNVYDEIYELKPSCVLVDEAQFLSESQVNQLFDLTVKQNIPVICYGLRTDFKTQLFPGSRRLFALAHSIEELKTICRCGKKAVFNGRKVDDVFIFKGSQVAIDGKEKVTYESLCGSCYANEVASGSTEK